MFSYFRTKLIKMKRITAITCTLFFVVLGITAHSQSKFRLGLHFSPNIGWSKSADENVKADGNNIKFGYGLIADINFNERYAFSTGLSVTKMGFNTKYDSASVISVKSTYVNQYIEIPLVLKLKTNEIGYFTYFGKFGLGTATLLKSSFERNGTVYGATFKEEGNGKGITQPVRFSLLVGLGAEYNVSGKTSILFGLDFNNGFTKNFKKKSIKNGSKGAPSENLSNSYIGLNIGILF